MLLLRNQFVGVGETLEKLEPFYPDRMASRILGMGDVVSLVEKAQEEIDTDDAMAMFTKMMTGEASDKVDGRSELAEGRGCSMCVCHTLFTTGSLLEGPSADRTASTALTLRRHLRLRRLHDADTHD